APCRGDREGARHRGDRAHGRERRQARSLRRRRDPRAELRHGTHPGGASRDRAAPGAARRGGALPARMNAAWEGIAAFTREEIGPDADAWIEAVPGALPQLAERWGLALGEPFDAETTSYVLP